MIATLTSPRSFDEFVDWYPENATDKYELHNGAIAHFSSLVQGPKFSDAMGFVAESMDLIDFFRTYALTLYVGWALPTVS